MEGRIALVTGASRGIGAASAKALGRHGAAVGVNYHQSEASAMAVADEIRAAGGRAVALRGDVRDEGQVRAMAAEAERTLGPVDTLVLEVLASAVKHERAAPRTRREHRPGDTWLVTFKTRMRQ